MAEKKDFKSSLLTTFTRAKQFTAEKIGATTQKTELNASYEHLCARTDAIKVTTERLISQTEVLLQPNPNRRIETVVMDKLKRKPRDRQNELEMLGNTMVEIGDKMGPETPYGEAITKVGQGEVDIGEKWCTFQNTVSEEFIKPLQTFVQSDMRTVQAERKKLTNARLDLDAAKTRTRKATTVDRQSQAEAAEMAAQNVFDQQYEVTNLLLENIQSTTDDQVNRLVALVEAQNAFFNAAAERTAALLNDLKRSEVPSSHRSSKFTEVSFSEQP